MQLGILAQDIVTGFDGRVTGHARYLSGSDQWQLTPAARDGSLREGHWFDEARLMAKEEKPLKIDNSSGAIVRKR